MPSTEVPRLTTALRAFAHLSVPHELPSDAEYKQLVAKKLKAKATQQAAANQLQWNLLSTTIKTFALRKKQEILVSLLRELLGASKNIVGDSVSSDVLESGAAFLFQLFMNISRVSASETITVRQMFGYHSVGDLQAVCDLVQRIVNLLDDETLNVLARKGEDKVTVPFGAKIKINPAIFKDFSQVKLPDSWKRKHKSLDITYRPPAPAPVVKKKSLQAGWLKSELERRLPGSSGLSTQDMCTTVFDILCSVHTDDQIQNELFDLLGFDQFEFIQDLLTKRRDIVQVMLQSPSAMGASAVSLFPRDVEVKPNYGAQVTIQSESEKNLIREIRKEEKKLSRKLEKSSGVDSPQSSGIELDVEYLKAVREEQLLTAATRPVFSGTIRDQTVVYPNVYDSLAKAKQSSAFVGGAKLALPEGFTKNGNKMFEEVNMPPTAKAPVSIGQNRVMISSLDQIAQLAFSNTKSLNRIQSVVFDTAYKTNENLLICAPTGAGKTNIAMLTILHTIHQHIEDGVIRKDKFKIVYVAPMKALAAEMVRNFGKRLEPLGVSVKELTGDMSLTKQEILKTQMLVTTPEKWDVVTRKSSGDVALVQLVKLLIIDEVHLLHEDRGSVIETLVARTLRQVESSQSMIRIVGLSATLPNYMDVAKFLRVNPFLGLFFFDGRFRPVPLGMTFVGIKTLNRIQRLADMNEICYEKVIEQVRNGEQVMVFVHARNETVRTGMSLRESAKQHGDTSYFKPEQTAGYGDALKSVGRSRNKQLKELFADGLGIHHAGMLRQDRNLVEKYFSEGYIKCLICTATLAWGVNLPAHAVIIKGTDIYDAKKGMFVDLGILDIQQIFGRAGRPQFDEYGHGTIITTYDKLSHYLSLLTQQNPIESQFEVGLTDNLNAEICLGTVTNLEEAVQWLSYTYMFVRMRYNPLVYGITYGQLSNDPNLEGHRRKLCIQAGKKLDKAQMIRFDEGPGYFYATDLGRTSSHYYIKYDTVEVINEKLSTFMQQPAILNMVSHAQEFQQLKVRDEELQELDRHMFDDCYLPVSGGSESTEGKVNILLQTYIGKQLVENFSLVSDMSYVAQNAGRIIRALFEIVLRKGWSVMTGRLLTLSKVIEHQLWDFEHPLRQFNELRPEILNKLEQFELSLDRLKEMDSNEIGHMVRHVKMGSTIKKFAHSIPSLNIEASVQPITRSVLRMKLTIVTDFDWNDRIHGNIAESFWIWVEDPNSNVIYHYEYFTLLKKQAVRKEEISLVFTIPIHEPLPSQYYVRCASDRWLGSDDMFAVSFQHLILPERHPPHTDLLDLRPLPVTALGDMNLAALYKFSHFNPVQTQIFHTVYHTDSNVLLGAPTGSGKTVAAEMAIFRLFRQYPGQKAVYIAPLKALVRERMDDWKIRIEQRLGKRVVEMTGDIAPDMKAIAAADLIVTTPEKWDGVSRSWQNRSYVQKVTLVIIDEIHLLGADRGPVLEVVVSRTNFISANTGHKVRVVGLSTALANARDLADWLGIKEMGLFNFRPSVRPVPLEVHISGFPGKHYCPRMATMNKPAFRAIKQHSPEKPVLIFVSSRRQTRLTALDLISLLAADDNPKQWLNMLDVEMENIIQGIRDTNLKFILAFGIGLHHAGLHERDRKVVEELFVNQKIQILVATSTLAWGVNFPAHLVVVKGTEYFDGKLKRYVDFPITDVLQMMGRAGRPQFDDNGVAVILVQDTKKHFYKKFLYEPFPVESSLLGVLADHMNAEIVAGTVTNKQEAMDYVTWTYFFRRLVQNPT